MDCINQFGLGMALSVVLFAGCSGSASPEATKKEAAAGTQQAAQTDPAANPVAQAASEWLDAVLKGDTQGASARLTPQAMHRIIESKMTFSPPGAGVDAEGFRIGEIRTPSLDQAIVQCLLSYNAEGKHHTEEMCCLLRHVDNDWRVSGIAFGTTADKPWTLVDFETGQDLPIPRQDMSSASSTPAANTVGNASRPSPRTAQEAPATSPTAERR
jgi:hypothetical protein